MGQWDSVYLPKYTIMQQNNNITYVQCVPPLDTLLLSISRTTYLENYGYLWEDQGQSYLEKFYSEENYSRELEDPAIDYYLIYVGITPAGFFKTKRLSSPELTGSSLEIDKLYLFKKFTGKKVGKQVLSEIECLAILQGHKEISLQVMDSSPAKLFYQKNGYTEVNQTRLTYPFMKQQYNLLLTLKKKVA
jgi:GNAT superfamily N-acetyltransferase